jgi:hypothetical protein
MTCAVPGPSRSRRVQVNSSLGQCHAVETRHTAEMPKYVLNRPIDAVRYVANVNASEVADLVKANGRRPNYSNQSGPLNFYNDGPELSINDGEWVVRIAGAIAVVTDDAFTAAFVAAEPRG